MKEFESSVPNLQIALGVSPIKTQPQKKVRATTMGKIKGQIIVGTPGTIVHKKWDASHANILVLDEADHLLDNPDNLKDIIKIREKMKSDAQILAFSSSISHAVKESFKRVCPTKCKFIFWNKESNVKDFKIICDNENVKYDIFKEILNNIVYVGQFFVFCQTENECHSLVEKLKLDRYDAEAITLGSSNEERDKIITGFERREISILVGTNELSRVESADVNSLVVNFDVPVKIDVSRRLVPDKLTYLHRIHRAGRWNRTGVAFNLVSSSDLKLLRRIEEDLGREIEEIPKDEVLDKIESIFTN